MTSKIILGGLIALAFVAGSIATGSVASAQQDGMTNPIVNALNALTAAVQGIEPEVNVDNEVIVPEDAIQVEVVGVQGPDGNKGPTGDKGPDGDKGPTGDPGTIKTYIESKVGAGDFEEKFTIIHTCDTNDVALAGGYAGVDMVLLGSFATDHDGNSRQADETAGGWTMTLLPTNPTFDSAVLQITCLDNEPFRSVGPGPVG